MAKKMTKEQYIKNIESIYGDRYSLISDFIDMNTKVIIKCNVCNETYELLPNEFTRNRPKNRNRFINGCDKCRLIEKTNELKNEVDLLTKGKISVIHKGLISNTHKEIDMKCNVCNHTFKQSIHVLKSNLKKVKDKENSFGCAVCSGKLKKNTEKFKKEVYNLVKDEYEVLGEYIDTDTYIRMKHNKCNTIYKVRPNDFLNSDNRCPSCFSNISNASKFIEQYLTKNNIIFIKEKKFKDCKYKKQLPFDFYLPEYNLLLEYDGEQHFKNSFKNTDFKIQHKRDIIKNKYCITNKINLIRVKYNVSIIKIKEILDNLFNEQLSIEDYKKYGLYVIDIEDDIIYNERTYYKEFM